ncbi:MAG: NAD(+) diphosphatase [Lachnospiraceae bacterium]|nr:NAD(+) diphosphatase [Lachnospiraceae bacterium]
MLQDITPHVLDNMFHFQDPKDTDYVIIMEGTKVLFHVDEEKEEITVPKVKDVLPFIQREDLTYLVALDEDAFFLLPYHEGMNLGKDLFSHYEFYDRNRFRDKIPEPLAYAAAVGFHLGSWYEINRFCGKCGAKMEHSTVERAMKCPECGNLVYPKICPSVIVGVIHKDKLLLTRYAGRRGKHLALIAGFTEIGETAEHTVHREVMEEVGLKVKNLKYFATQPWPFTCGFLMGYFAYLDGEDETITLDTSELADAMWISREDLPVQDSDMSLTSTMIDYFRNHPELDVVDR